MRDISGRFLSVLLWTALAGGIGGIMGNVISTPFMVPFDTSLASQDSFGRKLLGQIVLIMFIGTVMAASILATDNHLSLRGRWYRDLGRGLGILAACSAISGAIGTLVGMTIGITNAMVWGILGAGVGASVGLVRKDIVQAKRSALGGAIGGVVSGIIVDILLSISYTDASLLLGTMVGTVVTGALIGLCMQLVQGALKTAWLTGVTAGAYEGRQYLLNNERVTVGSSELHDISLYRASELRVPAGALEFKGGTWHWRGESAEVNGVPQTEVALNSGDCIKLGGTLFRFNTKTGAPEYVTPLSRPSAQAPQPSYQPQPSPPPVLHQAPAPPQAPPPAHHQPRLPQPTAPQMAPYVAWALVGHAGSVTLPAPPGRATIGRAPTNDIVLADPGVSSQHAMIQVESFGLQITDLHSTNGVTVNGTRMPVGVPLVLHEGDRVLLGQQEFVVRRTG